METTAFVYDARNRRRRTIRVIKVNRIIVLILAVFAILSVSTAFLALKVNGSRKVDKQSYYYLQMGQFTSSETALSKSAAIKNAGGCGYIINDGNFRIMAAVYATKADAVAVMKKLIESGTECSIYEKKIPSVKLQNYGSDSETKAIRALLIFPSNRLFIELQKQDMMLDVGETTDSAALLAVQNLKKELSDNYEKIIRYLAASPADKALGAMEKMYSNIIHALENYLPKGELAVGVNIKSTLCCLVEIYAESLSGMM